MTEELTRQEVVNQVQTIRQAQKRIKQKIKMIQRTLELLEDGTYPINQPWITFRRVTRVEDLRSKHTTLRSALMADLGELKELMESLKNEAKTMRLELYTRKTRRMRRRARRSERDFERRAKEMLEQAEKEGYLPQEEMEELRAEAEDVVGQWADILDREPSHKNIVSTLNSLYMPMVLGSESDRGELGKGMDSLQRAGRKRTNRARNRFLKTPTPKNAKRFFNRGAESQMLGGEEDDLWDTVHDSAGKRAGNAERRFRRNPTVKNYQVMHRAQIFYGEAGGTLYIYSPRGFRPTRRQKPYPVERGDTLPRLSKRFYGKRAYWDVIYRKNLDAIPKSFVLKPGMKLIIP